MSDATAKATAAVSFAVFVIFSVVLYALHKRAMRGIMPHAQAGHAQGGGTGRSESYMVRGRGGGVQTMRDVVDEENIELSPVAMPRLGPDEEDKVEEDDNYASGAIMGSLRPISISDEFIESMPPGEDDDTSQQIIDSMHPDADRQGVDQIPQTRGPISWLFPFCLAAPYATWLHREQEKLQRHPVDNYQCIMQHGQDCGRACTDWNCHDSAIRILYDISHSERIRPAVPLHPAATPYRLKCDTVFAAHSDAYKEITVIQQWQLKCLEAQRQHLLSRLGPGDRQDVDRIDILIAYLEAAGSRDVINRFRVGEAHYLSFCFDIDLVDEDLDSYPGDTIYMEGITVAQFQNRPDSISGKSLKCTALASIPKNPHAAYLYRDNA